jgi:hypothetical protein
MGWIILGVAVFLACLLTTPLAYAAQEPKDARNATLQRVSDRGSCEPYGPAMIKK